MADKQAEAVAPPSYNDAIYPKQPGTNPGMAQPPYPTQPGVNIHNVNPPYPQQGGIAPYSQPEQPAYPPGVATLRQKFLLYIFVIYIGIYIK